MKDHEAKTEEQIALPPASEWKYTTTQASIIEPLVVPTACGLMLDVSTAKCGDACDRRNVSERDFIFHISV